MDDEAAVLGSANVNMRSMAGTRDTEIAAAVYQPYRSGGGDADAGACSKCGAPAGARGIDAAPTPCGAVHHFRMSLWAEHLARAEAPFRWPSTTACARRVAALSRANWNAYAADEPRRLPYGHLMLYPLAVNHSGRVAPLKDFSELPDARGALVLPGPDVLGALPAALTT